MKGLFRILWRDCREAGLSITKSKPGDTGKADSKDFDFWIKLRKETWQPIVILSTDCSHPEQVNIRKNAMFKLMPPVLCLALMASLENTAIDFGTDRISLSEDLIFDRKKQIVIRNDKVYQLTTTEYRILNCLLQQMGDDSYK